MVIQQLRVSGFRNYERVELSPPPGITVLYGANAQGKTNLIEAVSLCCLGRSHRTPRDAELVRWGESMAQVRIRVQRRDGPHEVGVTLSRDEGRKKAIRINGTAIERMGELMGHVNAVLFSPEDLRLVKDGPEVRRRFLDMEISQLRPAYFYALQRYARALHQRNGLLHTLREEPGHALGVTLDDWDALLLEAGAQVIQRRIAYLQALEAESARIHGALSEGREALALRYAGQAEDAQTLERLLHAARGEDLRRGTTTVGPHRDDFRLLINGRDARLFASQGQQRTAALSLKLAETEVMRRMLDEPPVLLLDDVMSELDIKRRRMLLERLGGVQTLITCTDLSDLGGAKHDAAVRVENGALREETSEKESGHDTV